MLLESVSDPSLLSLWVLSGASSPLSWLYPPLPGYPQICICKGSFPGFCRSTQSSQVPSEPLSSVPLLVGKTKWHQSTQLLPRPSTTWCPSRVPLTASHKLHVVLILPAPDLTIFSLYLLHCQKLCLHHPCLGFFLSAIPPNAESIQSTMDYHSQPREDVPSSKRPPETCPFH